VIRIARLVVPLFIGIFTRAQEMADAMESRSYSDERALPELSFSKRDILLLLIVIPACAVCIFINTR
jgi:energy-coupling factor transporter transmembrane protein EcfT